MKTIHEERRLIIKDHSEKVKKLESKISLNSVNNRDNIFCTGNDASIFYEIKQLKNKLKNDLNFIERIYFRTA